MNHVLDAIGLDARTCAELLGISPRILGQWAAGQKEVPASAKRRLSAVLGVPESEFARAPKASSKPLEDVAPAIWFRLRGDDLSQADRECVLLIRQLGVYIDQLEDLTGARAIGWESLFEDIRRKTDLQAPPRQQGRDAARFFRESRGLTAQKTGVGEVFRTNLRHMGILVVESPIPSSRIEGCSFQVGTHALLRPTVFANSHGTTWFRRNEILMHEVAHAIFDTPTSGASLDFFSAVSHPSLSEERAAAFAREALVPSEVLRHVAQSKGLGWNRLSPTGVAQLVSELHIEKRTLARAAQDADLLTEAEGQVIVGMDIASDLRAVSDHALTTWDYAAKMGRTTPNEWIKYRQTTIPSRSLRLPAPYVKSVVEAEKDGLISSGKAAEMLMISNDDYRERFRKADPWFEDAPATY